MPTMLPGPAEVNALVDWLYGKENDGNASIAALSRHVRAHCHTRPCVGFSDEARWPNVEALKTNCRHYGPNVSLTAFDSAYASFVAS